MKTPAETAEENRGKNLIDTSSHVSQNNPRIKRSNMLTPVLLALPVIFIVIALTKVLASEEYQYTPLENETVWKLGEQPNIQTDTVTTLVK